MTEKPDVWGKELWTQAEVAKLFRASQSTMKNWRDAGLIGYWQPPGSKRVLYPCEEVRAFYKNNLIKKKGADRQKAERIREKPCVSPIKKEWRI